MTRFAPMRRFEVAPDRAEDVRAVVTYSVHETGVPEGHEASTRREIARRIASLSGSVYCGPYDDDADYSARPYFVPGQTLVRTDAARLDINGVQDLYGGVVPAAFVATKVITHPSVDDDAATPQGWSAEFPRRVAGVVLPGFAAFTKKDALRAGRRLLHHGPVRIKLASGIAGAGQWVVADVAALARAIAAIDDDEMTTSGIVVERNLDTVITRSVGQLQVAGLTASYFGTQQLTMNNSGTEVYGGSELCVVRGDFDTLLARDLAAGVRVAIAQAQAYDGAVAPAFPGFFASRRNYDVAQGIDASGCWRSGVLEQSWRLGGASGAEIGALEAFRSDPSLEVVYALTREVYGDCPPPSDAAAIYFRGIDPRVGPLTKYALVQPDACTR